MIQQDWPVQCIQNTAHSINRVQGHPIPQMSSDLATQLIGIHEQVDPAVGVRQGKTMGHRTASDIRATDVQ